MILNLTTPLAPFCNYYLQLEAIVNRQIIGNTSLGYHSWNGIQQLQIRTSYP
jgi:hypothetical protein